MWEYLSLFNLIRGEKEKYNELPRNTYSVMSCLTISQKMKSKVIMSR